MNKQNKAAAIAAVILFSVFYIFGDLPEDSKEPNINSNVGSSDNQNKSKSEPLNAACITGSEISNQTLNPIKSSNIYLNPSTSADKLINQRSTDLLGRTDYSEISDELTVIEFCTYKDWSYIETIKPEYLSDRKGWVLTSSLKQMNKNDDPYFGKILSSALTPYTKNNDPKLFSKLGSRMSEVESLRRKAAILALDSGKCDRVTTADVSDRSTSNKVQFFVDCENGERIRLDENEIKAKSSVATEAEKSWSEDAALKVCKEQIKLRSLIPSETDFHEIIGKIFYRAPTTQNLILTLDFDATNAFGTEIPYTAKCSFSPGMVGDIQVYKRE